MKIVKIPKRKPGEFRTIYVPSARQKKALRKMNKRLTETALKIAETCVHGFLPHRSCVTNALTHVSLEYTASFDLESFFDSCTLANLPGEVLTPREIEKCFVDGAARQGLPTSPAISNITASPLDRTILLRLRSCPDRRIVYTRYADDLTFSFNEAMTIEFLLREIPEIVARCGFSINAAKTHLQSASHGRRIITGIAVGPDGIHPTRAAKRRLRAAEHQKNRKNAYGLREWCRLKLPRPASFEDLLFHTTPSGLRFATITQ